MVRKRDYSEEIVEAARSVLLEVVRILGEYHEDILVVGGWVPELLLQDAKGEHTGSIDVDFAVNHQRINEAGYKSIREHLLARGYVQGKQPFIFFRTVRVGEHDIRVEVDFLAGEYGGTGNSHRTQRAQDLLPRKARGVDLAFEMPELISIKGKLPEGGQDETEILVASIPAFLVMKSMAMKSRLKEKDAWDIYYVLTNYTGGIDALIQEMEAIAGRGLVKEALSNLAGKFSSPEAVGPRHVADFEEIENPDDRELVRRDAYERVSYLVEKLGQASTG